MSESFASMEDRGVPEISAEEETALAARLTSEQLAEYAALDFTDLMGADAAAVVGRMRDLLVGELAAVRSERDELKQQLADSEAKRELVTEELADWRRVMGGGLR